MSVLFAKWIAENQVAEEAAFMAAPVPAVVESFTRHDCPHCGKRCKLPAGARIDRARCPRCDKRLTDRPAAPVASEPAAVPVAEVKPAEPLQAEPAPAEVPAAAVPAARPRGTGKLVDIYRPRTVAELSGQDWARDALSAFLADPQPGAFLFHGPTGTGKTSAALALAADLGVSVEHAECGGLHVIASGEQTGESVRSAVNALWCRPMMGSGWRVIVVNEADCITSNAAFKWLDVLEDLPPQCVVIFTTNDASKLPRRLRDRCEEVNFIGGALVLQAACEELSRRVWKEQTGRDDCPPLDAFGGWNVDGEASFRRLLQLMEPHVRVARQRGESLPWMLDTVEPEAKRRKRS